MTKTVTLKIASIKIGRELMNMNIKENNKYRYTDTAERNIRMNRFYIIASSLLAIVFLFYLWLKLVIHNIAPIVTYANTILIAVFCVVNAVTHLRNKATRLLKVFATIEIGIEYLLVVYRQMQVSFTMR